MQFTFGIITHNGDIDPILESIYNMDIPKDNYEIIIVGACDISYTENIKIISFDESVKNMWITRKKNLITQNATKENIVFLHDYIVFDKDWYKGYLDFGNDWDVCSNVQLTVTNERFRDWTLVDCAYDNFALNYGERIIPYDNESAQFVYINGTYWVAKTDFMIKYPLDESLAWGQSEDLEWSKRIKKGGATIKINPKSTVRLTRDKDVVFIPMCPVFYERTFRPFIMNKERRDYCFKKIYG